MVLEEWKVILNMGIVPVKLWKKPVLKLSDQESPTLGLFHLVDVKSGGNLGNTWRMRSRCWQRAGTGMQAQARPACRPEGSDFLFPPAPPEKMQACILPLLLDPFFHLSDISQNLLKGDTEAGTLQATQTATCNFQASNFHDFKERIKEN